MMTSQKMEDDLKKIKNGRPTKKMEDDLKIITVNPIQVRLDTGAYNPKNGPKCGW